MEIRPFRASDLVQATGIFASRYAEQRDATPELPPAWEEPQRVSHLLERLVAVGPALAATDHGRLVGYIGGWVMDGGDRPWVYAPEWAHGALVPDRRTTWEELYAAVLPDWLGRGARVQRVTLLAHDRELADALGWLSFGAHTIDLIRGIDAVGSDPYPVRRATVADTGTLVELREGLRRHLQSTPAYLPLPAPIDPDTERAKLADAAVATFLSEIDGAVVGFLRIGPSADGVATVVQDAHTASISGAFTVPHRRRAGIGRCLLDHGIAWARDTGYARIAVDFESMNLLAARFWRRTFAPVAVTMSRTIDAAAADEERDPDPDADHDRDQPRRR